MSGNLFSYEIANVLAYVDRVHPGHPDGPYACPFYLVVGPPGSGRSTAVRGMNLSWVVGDGPLQLSVPQQRCTYWLTKEAVFVEPEAEVLGPHRNPGLLSELCQGLRRLRPREPIDGMLLVVDLAAIADLDEPGLEAYARALRAYLVEVANALGVDVPTYLLCTRYDTLWGFADVFQWGPDRKGEEAWGFALPGDTDSQNAAPRIDAELAGLAARFEAFCLAKLSSEDPVEQRVAGFQHLAEVRQLLDKLRVVLRHVAAANAYERAPWIRALTIGSALPGNGDRIRVGVNRFAQFGVRQGPASRPARPGGLPILTYMSDLVLPEKDLVPIRRRWRDDNLTVTGFVVGLLLWIGYIAVNVYVMAG